MYVCTHTAHDSAQGQSGTTVYILQGAAGTLLSLYVSNSRISRFPNLNAPSHPPFSRYPTASHCRKGRVLASKGASNDNPPLIISVTDQNMACSTDLSVCRILMLCLAVIVDIYDRTRLRIYVEGRALHCNTNLPGIGQ